MPDAVFVTGSFNGWAEDAAPKSAPRTETEVRVKITVDVDCTPEEARAFLGLPDVKPMQDELIREMQERMAATVRAMEPHEMLEKPGCPTTMKGFEQLQEFFLQKGRRKTGVKATPKAPMAAAVPNRTSVFLRRRPDRSSRSGPDCHKSIPPKPVPASQIGRAALSIEAARSRSPAPPRGPAPA